MIIASHMVEHTALEEIWMVVSPHNPFKSKKSLAPDYDRLHLLQTAIGDHSKIRASNIEFDLPSPSYTIDTLTYLQEKYPQHEYALIMGGDNIASFHKWKNYEKILEHHEIYVYNRPGHEEHQFVGHTRVHFEEAPLLNLSASYIRKAIKEGHSIQYLVPDTVYQELLNSHLYRN
ncbi:UNVERIFIED_CONTAM: hypothetical protein GTU68_000615 [Idotea baltica]|nr:hypothetical protein [Idotea baltica]